jgi:hypothetical protein
MGNLILKAGINNTRSKIEKIDEDNKLEEAKLTSEFRRLLTKELIEINVISNYGKEDYREWCLKHNGYNNISIDIHFNLSDNPQINGTEIVIPFCNVKHEDEFSNLFINLILSTLETKNRGIKNECNNYRGQLLFVTPNFKNYCIELCFLTNTEDMVKYNKHKTKLITEFANLLKLIL